MGFGHGEKTLRSEEGIGPATVIRFGTPRPAMQPVLSAQQRAESPSDEAVEDVKDRMVSVFKVAVPTFQHRVEIRNDARQALPAGSSRFRPDFVLDGVETFRPHPTLTVFKAIAQEVKAVSRLPTVTHLGFIGVQGEAVFLSPGLHLV
jgi:hypothetical protein